MRQGPKQASLSPRFFKKERDAYDDWIRAFWRELFQNSVDAKAKNIYIDIFPTEGEGAFGENPTVQDIVRVKFKDDGVGMSGDVLRNVYFSLGETTKTGDNDSTGGYGRGRLVTCFANERYSILTRDHWVEGKGNLYECDTIANSIERKHLDAKYALENGSPEQSQKCIAQTQYLESNRSGYSGCEIIVDMDPSEYGTYSYRNPTESKLRATLNEYLAEAQLPCTVWIDDNLNQNKCMRGKKVRELYVKDPNSDQNLLFGTVHVTKSGKNLVHEGKVLYRIDGAPMSSRSINAPQQVIVEIDKKNHREFLTSNRDGFKANYQQVIDRFIDELVVDNVTALSEKRNIKDVTRTGKKGDIHVNNIEIAEEEIVSVSGNEKADAIKVAENIDGAHYHNIRRNIMTDGVGIIPGKAFQTLVQMISNGQRTFIDDYPEPKAVDSLKRLMQNYDPVDAFRECDPKLMRFIVSVMAERASKAMEKQNPVHDMNHLHIKIEEPNKEISKVIRNYDPENWDPETGKGANTRALFEAWTVACKKSIETLTKMHPSLGSIQVRTGWYFGKPTESYMLGTYNDLRTAALHQKLDDGTHLMLLNPVTEDGKMAYKISSKDDMYSLLTLAIHEASHVAVGSYHNQEFAYVQTELIKMMMPKAHDITKEMMEKMTAAKTAFKGGKSRSYPVEFGKHGVTDELRPSERLMAHAFPQTMYAAGVETGDNETNAIGGQIAASVSRRTDGGMDVECDFLKQIENELARKALEQRSHLEDENESGFGIQMK